MMHENKSRDQIEKVRADAMINYSITSPTTRPKVLNPRDPVTKGRRNKRNLIV